VKRGLWALGALAALGVLARWAAKHSPPTAVSGARAQLETLEEIFRSRNDNDPRLDRDFNSLSPEAKSLLREKYAALPRERRNERGTIVYLIGRNPSAPEDWSFLREAAAEPPCLSLADCSKSGTAEAEHGDEVTLAYPALVALKQAQRALEAGASAAPARSVIEAGKTSKAPVVVRLASRIEATTKVQSPVKP